MIDPVESLSLDAQEVEQGLLGGLMVDHQPHMAMPADMSHPVHAEILRLIEQVAANGGTPDPVTISTLIKDFPPYVQFGGLKYLAKLGRAAEALPEIQTYAIAAVVYANRRRLIELARSITEGALDRSREIADIVGGAQRHLEDLRTSTTATHRSYELLVEQIIDDLSRPIISYSTGLPSLDAVLEGGLFAGRVYAFAGRMKSGKSALLGTVARALGKAGVKTVYIALEMGAKELAYRLVAADLGCNAAAFLRRNMADLEERMLHYRERVMPTIDFEDRPGLTFDRLRALVAEHVRYRGAQVIVLDYWQLVQGQQRGETEVQHLGRVAQWMADAAKQFGVVFVTAAQLNREGQCRGGDGLRLACDVYMSIRPVETNDGRGTRQRELWLEMEDTRYTARRDVGSEEQPKLYVSPRGPVIEEYGAH